jgi:hypothetical protein
VVEEVGEVGEVEVEEAAFKFSDNEAPLEDERISLQRRRSSDTCSSAAAH